MRNTVSQAFRFRLLAWTLVALLFGAGEVLHQTLIHHSLDDADAPTCSVCKMSEHNLGDLSPAPASGDTVDQGVWGLETPVFAGVASPVFFERSPRAPPRA